MEILLALIMNILFIQIILLEYKSKSLSILFWGSLFLVFSFPHALDLIFKRNDYPISVMNKASLFVIEFNIMYLITRYLLVYRNLIFEWRIEKKNNKIEDKFMIYLFFALISSVILWSLGFYEVIGNIYSASWSDGLNIKTIYSIPGAYLFRSSAGLVSLMFLKGKKNKAKIISIILSLSVIFLTRARTNLIPLIMPIILYQVFYIKNYKSIFKVFILGVIFIISVSFLQQFRFLGSLSNVEKEDIKQVMEKSIDEVLDGKGESGLRKGMYKFIQNDNNYMNFGEGITYIRLLLLPIPNSIIKIKPRDFAYDMWDVINPHRTGIGGTYHPTFYGDLYGNFGEIGFVFGLIWALVFLFVDIIINNLPNILKFIMISPLSTMYLLLARGSVYNSIGNAFWSFWLINIIFLISRITLNKEKRPNEI